MSNITAYPLQDWFETTLAQSWNGAIGTVYLNTAPSFTFPSGVKTYIVVNPWKTNMQVGEIDSLHVWNKTVNVSSISVGSWAGTTYTQESHSVWSTVIISDNYQFWKNIVDAVNSKMDLSGGTFTGDVSFSWTGTEFRLPNLTTAERLALTPWNGTIVYDSTLWENYQYIAWAWNAFAAWSTQPNASETVAGKVELPNQTEFDAGTDTGGTWAKLTPTPSQIQNMVNTATAKTTMVDADLVLIWDSAASGINKKVTALNAKKYFTKFWGTWADGAVDGTAAVTIAGSNNTYIVKNYTSWAAGTAARILTITPTGCVLHIKVQGNMDLTNWTFDFAGKWTAGGAWSGTSGVTWSTGTATTQLLQLSSTGWIWWLSNNNSWQTAWAWGAGCWANGVASFNTPAWVTWKIYPLTVIQGRRCIEIWPWSGGGGWGWITGDCTWWAWWAWWGCVIVEVLGNLTLDNGTTVITVAWGAGSNGTNWANRSGWGGWGGWGGFYVMYHWTLTGTVTPTVSGWAGWLAWTWQASSGGTWWVGWVGLSLIEADTVFS